MANNFGKALIEVGGGDSYVSERECGGGGANRGQPLACGNTGGQPLVCGNTAITGMYMYYVCSCMCILKSHAVQYDTYIIKLNAYIQQINSRFCVGNLRTRILL